MFYQLWSTHNKMYTYATYLDIVATGLQRVCDGLELVKDLGLVAAHLGDLVGTPDPSLHLLTLQIKK